MKKVWTTVFLLFGTIVGSGFSSGKEILVFFSRFGELSYLYIVIACVLFFLLFYLFLSKGKFVMDKLEKLKIVNIILVFISIVFTASMFAGLKSLFMFSNSFLYIILCALLLLFTVFITLKGMGMLEKVTLVLMPVCVFIFLAVLIYICFQNPEFTVQAKSPFGYFYCPLYVALNFSTSTFIVSKAGRELNKKQTFFVSLFSSLLLLAFLLFANFALRTHVDSHFADMPFLYLCQNNSFFFVLCYVVILIGCLTTLFSLCLTIKASVEGMFKGEVLGIFIAIFLPFLISEFGFSKIVANLYPLASVLGISVLLFFIYSFKQTDKRIHHKRQNTKNKSRTHY